MEFKKCPELDSRGQLVNRAFKAEDPTLLLRAGIKGLIPAKYQSRRPVFCFSASAEADGRDRPHR